MQISVPARTRAIALAVLGSTALLASACGGKTAPPVPAAGKPDATPAPVANADDAPVTRDMGSFILAKINATPAIDGKATLVEFRQKSVATQPLGDKMKSAVVEFEGVVKFSNDVSWSWQLVEPLGIYPL